MDRITKIWLFAAGASLLILGAWGIKQYRQLMDGIYRGFSVLSGAIIHSLSSKLVKITLLFKIDNKGDLSVDVVSQNYIVYINGTQVASVNTSEVIHILKNDFTTFPLPIEFKPSDLIRAGVKNSDAIFTDHSKIKISIKGTFSFRVVAAGKLKANLLKINNYPLNESFTLADIEKSVKQKSTAKA